MAQLVKTVPGLWQRLLPIIFLGLYLWSGFILVTPSTYNQIQINGAVIQWEGRILVYYASAEAVRLPGAVSRPRFIFFIPLQLVTEYFIVVTE